MKPKDDLPAAGATPLARQRLMRIEQATVWRSRLVEDAATAQDEAYLAWISDPLNHSAMQDVADAWNGIEELAATPEVLILREKALADARHVAGRRWRRLGSPLRAIAASVLLAITLSVAAYFYVGHSSASTRHFATAVAERRVVTLEDGSILSMDSDTHVSIRFSRAQRALSLKGGRARFQVAHDGARAFTVEAGGQTVFALGTNFSVERLPEKVLVTLLEGRVVVSPSEPDQSAGSEPLSAAHRRHSVILAPGQRLTANADSPYVVEPANLRAATSWESGRLEFTDELLGEAVIRVNRYTLQPVTVDPAVAGLRFTGVFNAGDVASFVDAIASYFPVDAAAVDGHVVLRVRRP